MYEKKYGVTIVIPTYNERENIKILIPLIHEKLKDVCKYEILIVDDDSPDGTWKTAKSLALNYPVRVYRRINKKGLASAILDGIARASYENVIVMDADLQHPPNILVAMIEALQKYELVIASRYVRGGGVEHWSKHRLLISKVATLLAHILLPRTRGICDPMSGYFGLKKWIIRGVKLNVLGYKLLLEIIVKGKYRRVKEIPYVFKQRIYGESKLSRNTILDYVRHLLLLMSQTSRLDMLGLVVLSTAFFVLVKILLHFLCKLLHISHILSKVLH